jgi:CubicO group peptidase (beta-lactamase class C family)
MMTFSPYAKVMDYLSEEVYMGRLPGAVLNIGTSKGLLFQKSIGYAQVFPERRPMQERILFDIASLTKVVVTSCAILQLIENKKLDLYTPLSSVLPEYKGNSRDEITILNLLTHTSGLPNDLNSKDYSWSKEELWNHLFQTEISTEVGSTVVYSDLNFMLLGNIIEKVSGKPLDKYAEEHIFQPLDMTSTSFNPPKEERITAAATEYRRELGHYRCGEVHDSKATILGGVSGSAGVFSTVQDLASLATCLLNNGRFAGGDLLKEKTIKSMSSNHTTDLNLSRGLGWVVYEPEDQSFGGNFRTPGYGHTGFTGTSLYINPLLDLYVILLTNRVHFGRTDDIQYIRNQVHQLISDIFLAS